MRRGVFGDLVGHLARSARDLARVGGARADADRPFRLEPGADQITLPLAVLVELVEVGEHVLLRTADLDAAGNHKMPPQSAANDDPLRSGDAVQPGRPIGWGRNTDQGGSKAD